MKRPGGRIQHFRSSSQPIKKSANIPILFERVKVALEGMPWEMIVVDDNSPDGTSNVAFALAAEDRRLRCLRRVNRSGLAGAVIEGWMSSSADFVAVIDGDLQHDKSILRAMYQTLAKGSGDLVIGTRLREARGGILSPARQRLSDLGAWFFRLIARSGRYRPDEWLLHDSARYRLSSRSASFARWFQDPDRRNSLGRWRPEYCRSPLSISQAPHWRVQADRASWRRLPWSGRSPC